MVSMEINVQKDSRAAASSKHPNSNKKSFLRGIIDLFTGRNTAVVPEPEHDEIRELIEDIKTARKEWVVSTMEFENASDKEIIDYYTYKIKANEVRYQYYLKLAKEKGVKVEAMDY